MQDIAIIGRAAFRSECTGLPLSMMIKSEVARRRRQIEAGQLSPVHPVPATPEPIQAGKALVEEAKKARPPRKAKEVVPAAETTAATKDEASPVDPFQDPEYTRRLGNVGNGVKWSAFGQENAGTIEAVIPVGKTPREMDIEAGSDKAKPRDHVSYVVRKDDGSLVWPVFSALKAA